MLYLGIDLHRKQMTISLRNSSGDVLQRRQVSTRWPKLAEFREQLAAVGRATAGDGQADCRPLHGQPGRAVTSDDTRRKHVHRRGDRLPNHPQRTKESEALTLAAMEELQALESDTNDEQKESNNDD